MAYDENSHISLFGQLHQLHGAVLHLAHAACRRVQLVVIQGLNGVHNENIRLLLLHALQHVTQIRLGQDIKAAALCLQPLGAQLQLVDRLLTGYVQHAKLLAQLLADLQHQGGFADSGGAAYQDQGAFHGTAAQNAVQLAHAGGKSDLLILTQICNAFCLYREPV